jgi:hypothetical protein
MLQLFLILYIRVRISKKSFALTFKHLFSAINIIIKQHHLKYRNKLQKNGKRS